VTSQSREWIKEILRAAKPNGRRMRPLEIFKAQTPPMNMTEVSIRQLLGVMLGTADVCKDPSGKVGYFLRASLPPEELRDWDYKEALRGFKQVGDSLRTKHGVQSKTILRAANAYIKYEDARHKKAKEAKAT
jgi:hypothetical protein